MEAAITQAIFDFSAAWAAGSGDSMARCFTDDAHFIAYDGTRLRGGAAIGQWHQPALDSVLRNTRLEVRIDEIRMLTPELALVLASGGPEDDGGSAASRLIGDSHETFLVRRLADGQWKLASLQVTRRRPLDGPRTAMIWQAFNHAWVEDKLA